MINLAGNERNGNLAITNQTSSTVIIASAFDDTNSGKIGYAQQLSAFPDNANPTQIAAKGTGTITLDKTYNENGTQQPILDYDLIAMRPQDLFPVSDRAVLPVDCKTQPSPKCNGGYDFYYNDITIAQDEADAMQQSYEFNKGILSYPDSDLAKTFVNILSEYQSDPEKLEKEVNSFFQNQTTNYKKCTLDSFVATSTYSQQFAFAWADLQSSYTYYVFQVAQNQQPSASGMTSIAKIVFTKKSDAPNPADVNDCNGGFEITYEPKSGETRKLSLVNGSLVTTSNPDFPDVALLVSFTLKSMFTGDVNDNEIWPVLAGKIDGFTVIAVGQDAKALPDSWYEFFHPQTAQQWAGLIGSIIGLAFAIYFLAEKGYALVKWYRQKRARGEIPTWDDIKNKFGEISGKLKSCWKPKIDELESLLDADTPETYATFSKVTDEIKKGRSLLEEGAFQATKDQIQATKEVAQKAADKALTEFEAQLEAIAKLNDGEAVQAAGEWFMNAKDEYKQAVTSGDFTGVSRNLARGQTFLDVAIAGVTNLTPKVQAQLDAWKQSIEDFGEVAQKAKDVIEEDESVIIDE